MAKAESIVQTIEKIYDVWDTKEGFFHAVIKMLANTIPSIARKI